MAYSTHRAGTNDPAETTTGTTADNTTTGDHRRPVSTEPVDDPAREKFGGGNLGAAFFGWLVAIAVTVLLTGIVGAIASAVGNANDVTQSDAQRQAGTVGLTAAIVMVCVLALGYYAGGYVAGRMSRFDGGRQGFLVWLIGLVVTVVAVVVGWVAGSQYNVLDRVDLPRIPIPKDTLTWGGVITGLAVLLLTLLLAVIGGKVGRHYHDRVDRASAYHR
jgi:MFS family permease